MGEAAISCADYDPARMAGLVAPHLRLGLRAYIETGQPTGDGLRRVISNLPVFEVLGGLDDQARVALPGLLKFLYNYSPGDCWGSAEAYQAWCARGGLDGAQGGQA